LFEHQIIVCSCLSLTQGGLPEQKRLQFVLCVLSLFHNGYQSQVILLVRAVPGESINLPVTYLGSQTWFRRYQTSVGSPIVGNQLYCQFSYSVFQFWQLDQNVGWPAGLGASGANKLDY
ncbi:MAG: hypothetical protein EZS28_049365, partial [Streblomastix strix]